MNQNSSLKNIKLYTYLHGKYFLVTYLLSGLNYVCFTNFEQYEMFSV